MSLLAAYSVYDNQYLAGLLNKIEGTQPGAPSTVSLPSTTNYALSSADDRDVSVHCHMNGASPRILLATYRASLQHGVYTVIDPSLFAAIGTPNKRLKVGNDYVAINPRASAVIGDHLYLAEYDSVKIYQIALADLESTLSSGVDYITPVGVLDLAEEPTPNAALGHGVQLLAIGSELHFLYMAATNPWGTTPAAADYKPSVVSKILVDAGDGSMTFDSYAEVGKNGFDLVPFTVSDETHLFVPCLGGIQQYGYTNADDSVLDAVQISDMTKKTLLKGAVSTQPGVTWPPVSSSTYFDIHGFAVNEAGVCYLLLNSLSQYMANYWKVFKADAASLLAIATPTSLNDQFDNSSPVAQQLGANGDNGNYPVIMFENAALPLNSRVWFVKPFRNRSDSAILIADQDWSSTLPIKMEDISATLNDDGTKKLLPNINSFCLYAEMIYQANKTKAAVSRSFIMRGYVAPQVASGAFASHSAFLEYESVRLRHEEKHGE